MAVTKIQTVTVGAGGAASIDFTSIPGTYTDLMVVLSARGSVSAVADEMLLTFNSSASGYSARDLYGNGSSAASSSSSGAAFIAKIWMPLATATSNTFGSAQIYIPNYAGATNKSISSDSAAETNATTTYANIMAGLWANTSAITSITIKFGSGNIVQYSSATLYGIKSGSSGGVTVS